VLDRIEVMALMFERGPPIEEASGTRRHELRRDGVSVGGLWVCVRLLASKQASSPHKQAVILGKGAFRTQSMPDPAGPAVPSGAAVAAVPAVPAEPAVSIGPMSFRHRRCTLLRT
jgi:hypothetical protein